MSVSKTLQLIFCSALLAASCGAEIEPISEAASTTPPSTPSTTPQPESPSTQQTDTAESTPPPLLPVLDEAFTLTISTKGESGLIIDGEYVSDEPEGSFRWSSRLDAVPPQGYSYFLREGQAEAGDYGCIETIKINDTWHIRSTLDPEPDEGNAIFVPMDEAESADISAGFSEASFPTTVADLFEAIGMTVPANSESAVFEVELEDAQIESAIEALWATWSFIVPASGTMTVSQTPDGHLINVVLEAAGSIDQGRSQSVSIEASINPLDNPMLLDSPRPNAGFCRNQTLDTIGTWNLTGVVGGESVAPVELLPPEIATAFIEIAADGSVSGSTGCQTFAGFVDFGYRRWLNPRLEFAESECSADQEELATELKTALLSGPSAGVRPEGTMWVVTEQTELGFLYEAK